MNLYITYRNLSPIIMNYIESWNSKIITMRSIILISSNLSPKFELNFYPSRFSILVPKLKGYILLSNANRKKNTDGINIPYKNTILTGIKYLLSSSELNASEI